MQLNEVKALDFSYKTIELTIIKLFLLLCRYFNSEFDGEAVLAVYVKNM